jgi:hypothetical protein
MRVPEVCVFLCFQRSLHQILASFLLMHLHKPLTILQFLYKIRCIFFKA